MARSPILRSRKVVLDANGEATVLYGGEVFFFDTSGSSVSIDVTWLDNEGHELGGTVAGVLLGRLLRAGAPFGGVRISGGDPNDTLQIYVGPSGAYARESVTNAVIGNVTVINEVEVKNDAGNPLNVAVDAGAKPRGVTLTDETNAGLIAVTDAGIALLAADATRKSVRFRNVGPDDVALIAALANSFANAAVVLRAGETWNEIEAPGAAWFSQTDVGGAAEVAIQTVKP